MRPLRITLIVGTRPQFVKLSPVMDAIKEFRYITPTIIHTGQHYDYEMSKVFFEGLDIPEPDYNIGINGGSHAQQVGRMMEALEVPLQSSRPNVVIVFGDSNTTLAGALVASKFKIPLAHIEAGVRCGEKIPEETNRTLVDSVSDFLFCPTRTAFRNAYSTGTDFQKQYFSGDVMKDLFDTLYLRGLYRTKDISKERYLLLTVHREEGLSQGSLFYILNHMSQQRIKVIFPAHPRVKKIMDKEFIEPWPNIEVIKPVSYLRSIELIRDAVGVVTDSGGIQKEAYFCNTPCTTLRRTTEWPETLEDGWNVLSDRPSKGWNQREGREGLRFCRENTSAFGDGKAAYKIIKTLYEEVPR
mgnify:CR=1 FL=1